MTPSTSNLNGNILAGRVPYVYEKEPVARSQLGSAVHDATNLNTIALPTIRHDDTKVYLSKCGTHLANMARAGYQKTLVSEWNRACKDEGSASPS